MTNRPAERLKDFWRQRKGIESLSSDEIREGLKHKTLGGSETVARQILRERGERET